MSGFHGVGSKDSACNTTDPDFNLGWEDPLEKGMSTHSSILTWIISIDKGPWLAYSP